MHMCMVCLSSGYSVAAMSMKLSTLIVRGVVLFIIGVIFALVLNLLQVQRQITLFPGVLDNVFSSAWWVPPSCGTAAGMFIALIFVIIAIHSHVVNIFCSRLLKGIAFSCFYCVFILQLCVRNLYIYYKQTCSMNQAVEILLS